MTVAKHSDAIRALLAFEADLVVIVAPPVGVPANRRKSRATLWDGEISILNHATTGLWLNAPPVGVPANRRKSRATRWDDASAPHGLDPNPDWLAFARAKGPPEIRWIAGDARALSFPDRSFDSVLCASLMRSLLS